MVNTKIELKLQLDFYLLAASVAASWQDPVSRSFPLMMLTMMMKMVEVVLMDIYNRSSALLTYSGYLGICHMVLPTGGIDYFVDNSHDSDADNDGDDSHIFSVWAVINQDRYEVEDN